jgi:hypothetical protein
MRHNCVATAFGIAAALALLAPRDAAALLFVAQTGHNTAVTTIPEGDCVPAGNDSHTSTTGPVSAEFTCGNFNGVEHGTAGSDFGHVGGTVLAASVTGGTRLRVGSSVRFRDDTFVFSSIHPLAYQGGVLSALNLGVAGEISATAHAGASITFSVEVNGAQVALFQRSEADGAVLSCVSTFAGGAGGPLCDAVGFPGGGFLVTTGNFIVPLDTPFSVELALDIEAGAADVGTTAGADFGHSFDFVTGMDLFVLPDDVTVDAPDTFVADNRFAPPRAGAAPTPATLGLLLSGLGGLAFARRGPR